MGRLAIPARSPRANGRKKAPFVRLQDRSICAKSRRPRQEAASPEKKGVRVAARPAVPPGPSAFGVLRSFARGSFAQTLAFLQTASRFHGSLSSFAAGPRRVYFVDDPELIREVLVLQQHRFARPAGMRLFRKVVGENVITSEEPLHRRRRRLLQPAFHRARLESYAALVVREAHRVGEGWRDGTTLDVGGEMLRVTLAIVGAILFGSDVSARAELLEPPLRRAMATIAALAPLVEIMPPRLYDILEGSALPVNARLSEARRTMAAVIAPLLAQRRAGDAPAGDVLSLLLGSVDENGEQLGEAAVADELVGLLFAGHETTASALTWCWHLLATHPAVESRLRTELDGVLGARDPVFADLPRLDYTRSVFLETLRLYPPAAAFARRVASPASLAGFTLPAGASVLLSPYVTHRNPRWFARPDAFDPERWRGPESPPPAFFPFGAGARVCLGEHFAILEGVLVLATLARRVRLRRATPEALGIASHATLRPDRPVLMRVTR
jgi:cytochrome P450